MVWTAEQHAACDMAIMRHKCVTQLGHVINFLQHPIGVGMATAIWNSHAALGIYVCGR
jgi:hypothetical protein